MCTDSNSVGRIFYCSLSVIKKISRPALINCIKKRTLSRAINLTGKEPSCRGGRYRFKSDLARYLKEKSPQVRQDIC